MNPQKTLPFVKAIFCSGLLFYLKLQQHKKNGKYIRHLFWETFDKI